MKTGLLARLFLWAALLVTVLPASAIPTIVVPPVSLLNGVLGTASVFLVTATGKGNVTYQWRRNGNAIPGATSPLYTILSLSPEDAGTISVLITDDDGTVETAPVKLLVLLPVATENNNFSGRYGLGLSSSGHMRSVSTAATSKETGEPDHAGEPGGKSVWFKWRALTSGVLKVNTRGSGFDTVLAAYTGSSVGALTPVSVVASDDDDGGYLTSEISFNVAAGTEYQIAVDGVGAAYGDISLNWAYESVLTTDLLPIITSLPARQLTLPDGGDLSLAVGLGANTQGRWFRDGLDLGVTESIFTAGRLDETKVGRYYMEVASTRNLGLVLKTIPTDVQINITDENGSDPKLAAFDKLSQSVRSVQTSGLAANKTATAGKSGGGQSLASSGGSTASAGASRGYTTTQVFSTAGATKDPGEPNHCGVVGGASEWFSYKAPMTGRMYVNTDGTSFNSVLAVYKGTGFDYAGLTAVACNNSAGKGGDRVWFNCTSGTTYYIAVDGVGGATGTVKLNVNVGEAPAFVAQPPARVAKEGTNVTFACAVSGSTNKLTFQWRRNGTNLAGATTSTYTINSLANAHAGQYTVTVSNLVDGVTSTNALLTVATAPSIVNQPADKQVTPGQSTSFSVAATGTASLAYRWRFNGNDIAGATGSTLTLASPQPTNSGSYSVVVSNVAGMTVSSNASLVVAVAPVLVSQPASQTAGAGEPVTLLVVASGSPAPSYQWTFNGTNLSGATDSALTIPSFQTNYTGEYAVTVSNSLGSVQSTNLQLLANWPLRLGKSGSTACGNFQMELVGKAGSNYVLEATVDLQTWFPVATNTAERGLICLTDTNAVGTQMRFYRATPLP